MRVCLRARKKTVEHRRSAGLQDHLVELIIEFDERVARGQITHQVERDGNRGIKRRIELVLLTRFLQPLEHVLGAHHGQGHLRSERIVEHGMSSR